MPQFVKTFHETQIIILRSPPHEDPAPHTDIIDAGIIEHSHIARRYTPVNSYRLFREGPSRLRNLRRCFRQESPPVSAGIYCEKKKCIEMSGCLVDHVESSFRADRQTRRKSPAPYFIREARVVDL